MSAAASTVGRRAEIARMAIGVLQRDGESTVVAIARELQVTTSTLSASLTPAIQSGRVRSTMVRQKGARGGARRLELVHPDARAPRCVTHHDQSRRSLEGVVCDVLVVAWRANRRWVDGAWVTGALQREVPVEQVVIALGRLTARGMAERRPGEDGAPEWRWRPSPKDRDRWNGQVGL